MALRMRVSIRVRVNSRPSPSRTQTRLLPCHSPIFTTFRAPLASSNDGSLPFVFSPTPATPTMWRLDAHKSNEDHDLLVHYRDHPQLHNLANQRTIFVRARTTLYPLAYAATVLDLRHKHTTSDIHDAVDRAYTEPRYNRAHVNVQRDTILSHIATAEKDEFDAADFIKQYKTALTIWHTSLAEGLRTAYGMVNQPARPRDARGEVTRDRRTRNKAAVRFFFAPHRTRRGNNKTPTTARHRELRDPRPGPSDDRSRKLARSLVEWH